LQEAWPSFLAVASRRGEMLPILPTARNPEADLGLVTLVEYFTGAVPTNRSEITFDGVVYRVMEVRKNAVWLQLDLKRFE
jgi:hypothetical protein